MRTTLYTTLAAGLIALLSSVGGAQAATDPAAINAVLGECPTEARVGTCGSAVVDFANSLPRDAERNDDLLALVSALAQEAQGTDSPIICQEIETSIRLAGQAAAGASVQEQIAAIADGLCAGGDVDSMSTGSIGGGNGGGSTYTPPPSEVTQDDPDDTPPPQNPPTDPDDNPDDPDDVPSDIVIEQNPS